MHCCRLFIRKKKSIEHTLHLDVEDRNQNSCLLCVKYRPTSTTPKSVGRKTHRRLASGNSVMDPLYVELAFVLHDIVIKYLIEEKRYLEELWSLGITCRTANVVIFPLSQLYTFIYKTNMNLSHVKSRVIFWQNCTLHSNDMSCATTLLQNTFSQLFVLYLNNNHICDEGCISIVNSSRRLHHLSLACNLVTDKGAKITIEKLVYLHELNLRGNPLSPSVRSWLQTLHIPNRMFIAV